LTNVYSDDISLYALYQIVERPVSNFRKFFQSVTRPNNTAWRRDTITDSWFSSHFNYATDVVFEWVGQERLRGTHVLDFGCGDGITALGLMLRYGADRITGIDVSETHRGLAKLARREIGLSSLPKQLEFQKISAGEPFKLNRKCDVIISWSTFEHIELRYLSGILQNLHQQLSDDGVFFLQINPLYFSPFGSHLGRFELAPWAHLLYSPAQITDAVMAYEGNIPADELEENFYKRDFKAYKEFVLNEYQQLNRLRTTELIQHFTAHGFQVVREQYGKVDICPPVALTDNFSLHDLTTDEVRLLLQKRR
jgi:2-polyprenyl-3-methyl-5-hydroxy-6-metoxy-1,4-benzoquinol methylase